MGFTASVWEMSTPPILLPRYGRLHLSLLGGTPMNNKSLVVRSFCEYVNCCAEVGHSAIFVFATIYRHLIRSLKPRQMAAVCWITTWAPWRARRCHWLHTRVPAGTSHCRSHYFWFLVWLSADYHLYTLFVWLFWSVPASWFLLLGLLLSPSA